MTIKFVEHVGCFELSIQPETKEEVVSLARFGLNRTKELRYASVYFNQDGTSSASIVIGKKKQPTTYIEQ